MKKRETPASTPWLSSTRTGRSWAITARPTSRMDCPTRRNFILHPETRDLRFGIPGTEKSAAVSAGISGFRSRPDVWRFWVRSCSFTRRPLAASRFFRMIHIVTGCGACRGHAAANIMPVIASNRIGTETEGDSSMTFYGSSFITDETGALAAEADRESETC